MQTAYCRHLFIGLFATVFLAAAAPAHSKARDLYVENKCWKTTRFAVVYRNPKNDWTSRGFFTAKPGKRIKIGRTRERYAYLYGYLQNVKRQYRWDGDAMETAVCGSWGCGDKIYGFRKIRFKNSKNKSSLTIGMDCKNYKR